MSDAKTLPGDSLEQSANLVADECEWFVNCLEYGRGVPGALWVRPDSDTSTLLAALESDEQTP